MTFTVTDTSPREFNFQVEPPEDPKDTTWLFARAKDGKHAGTADLEPNQAEATLVLVPTATIKVRLVDADGNPLPAGVKFEWGIRIDMGELAKGAPFSKLVFDQMVETDADGRLTLRDMLVGVPHDVNRVTGKGRFRRAFQLKADKSGDQIWPSDVVVPDP